MWPSWRVAHHSEIAAELRRYTVPGQKPKPRQFVLISAGAFIPISRNGSAAGCERGLEIWLTIGSIMLRPRLCIGIFRRQLTPQISVDSGDTVTISTYPAWRARCRRRLM